MDYFSGSLDGDCDFEINLNDNILTVNSIEGYGNLSEKTFKMLKACETSIAFDFLIKIDSKIIENMHNKTSDLFSFDNFTKCFYNETIFSDYGGFTPINGTTITSFRNWASSKKLFVLPEIFLSNHNLDSFPSHYWAGGAYCLSSENVKKIIKKSKLFEDCKNLIGGCEDLCVGIACNE